MADEKCICIIFNDYLLAPTPMVKISRSFQEQAGRIIGSTVNVSLEGKIVASTAVDRNTLLAQYLAKYPCVTTGIVGISEPGINNMMQEERALRKVFSNSNYTYQDTDVTGGIQNANPSSNLFVIAVKGGGTDHNLVYGYAKVTSYSTSPTSNNWTQTIDYTIELEVEEPKHLFIDGDGAYLLSSITDDISIEPLEESNPFNPLDPVFSTYFGRQMSDIFWGGNNYAANAYRYRISRTIEAVGKHSYNETGNTSTEGAPTALTSNSSWNGVLGDQDRRPKALSSTGQGTAFNNARSYVLDRLARYPTQYFLANWTLVNRIRTLAPNEVAGSFRITESSVAINPEYHPSWTDDWTAEISIDSTFLQTVRINGTIKGYESYGDNVRMDVGTKFGAQPYIAINNNPHSGIIQPAIPAITPSVSPVTNQMVGKYQNAMSGLLWLKSPPIPTNPSNTNNIYSSPIAKRAELFFNNSNIANNTYNPYRWLNSNTVLAERQVTPAPPLMMNPIPVSMTESHRSYAGEIDYTFEFNNRPLNLVRGSISEVLNIQDSFPTQQIAEIFVLGRKLGPVLQDLNTVSSASRDVTFEVVLPRPRSLASRTIFPTEIYQAATGVVEQMNPKYMFGSTSATNTSIKSFVKTDNQSWNPLEGKLSIQKSWIWQRAK